jgi:hypothetical protein
MAQKLETIKQQLEECDKHHSKFYGMGIKKSSTDLRKSLMRIIKLCQELRKETIEKRKAMSPKTRKA